MTILIKNGRLIDPANNLDDVRDILLEGERISRIDSRLDLKADYVIEAKDRIVMPGIVDMHVHLREPGREDKETVESGTRAALKGGVTSVLAMPNTLVAIDCIENIRLLQDIISRTAQANVFIAAAITQGRRGCQLTDIKGLKMQGAVAISDDGLSVDNDDLMFEALKKAKENGILVICHSEDKLLSGQGVVNLGFVSTRLGLRGISRESEYRRLERDIRLAEKADAAVHIAHVSCRESVEIIARAKKRGVRVSCETAPHYFALTEDEVSGYDTNMKMNPPLRGRDDTEAVRQGLRDGTIDAIASDHAPHTANEKDVEFDSAEFGVVGLETELAVCLTELAQPGLLSWPELAKKLSLNPARILGIDKGTLTVGKDADIVIMDPDKEWVVKKEGFVSKSKNSAFLGRRMKGAVEYTICAGKIAYQNI